MKTLLVSGGFTYFTDRVRDELGIDHAYSNTLVVEAGKLAGAVTGPLVDAQGKAGHLARLEARDGDCDASASSRSATVPTTCR